MSRDPNCIFCRIAARELPAKLVYEDDEVVAFPDLHPIAPVHLLIVPKEHFISLAEAQEKHVALLGKILLLAPRLAREQGATNGFRVIINNGPDGGQEIHHLHVHVLGGPRPWKRL